MFEDPGTFGRRGGRLRRYAELAGICAKHLALLPFRARGRRFADAARLAAEDAGPTFVKLAQALSTRCDLLPAAFVEEFARLQHEVAPAAWGRVERDLVAALGGPLSQTFAAFEREPIAAGSIAQVHGARLHDGTPVVAKVRRPGIEVVVRRDLDVLRQVARVVERFDRRPRPVRLTEIVEGFAAALLGELDFEAEAANVAAFSEGFRDAGFAGSGFWREPAMRVPTVHEAVSGAGVLVLERLSGVPLAIAERRLREAGVDRRRLAEDLLNQLLRQIMVTGTFHGDPHPGNVLLMDDGSLALLDFGVVGRIDVSVRANIGRLLLATEEANAARMCEALLAVVEAPADLDRPGLLRGLETFMRAHLCGEATLGITTFTDLFELVRAHGLEAPREVLAVFRALATLDGTLARLVPGFDLIGAARAQATALAGELAVQQLGEASARIVHVVRDQLVAVGADTALWSGLARRVAALPALLGR